ncbi:MAG: hypothetical protein MR598_05455 [Erysipelotrichaceae bacterium]|nr:hypothetical protein [Erysipelotrichaceae bacterium]
MQKLKKEEMFTIKGGAGFSSAMLNAMMRTVSVMFSIGQAVGSAIRRAVNGSYC